MRLLGRTTVVVALATAAGFSAGTALASAEDDVAAAMQSWADAYNSHDPARVASQYREDAVFWGTTSPTLRDSPDKILEYFGSLSRRPYAHVTIGEHVVRVADDVALVTGFYTFTDRVDDQLVTRPARFSFAFRLADGQWRLAQHHSSRLPE
jgi:uncharacterized protein (TIGR02246 family)